jgi:hypothetical protein
MNCWAPGLHPFLSNIATHHQWDKTRGCPCRGHENPGKRCSYPSELRHPEPSTARMTATQQHCHRGSMWQAMGSRLQKRWHHPHPDHIPVQSPLVEGKPAAGWLPRKHTGPVTAQQCKRKPGTGLCHQPVFFRKGKPLGSPWPPNSAPRSPTRDGMWCISHYQTADTCKQHSATGHCMMIQRVACPGHSMSRPQAGRCCQGQLVALRVPRATHCNTGRMIWVAQHHATRQCCLHQPQHPVYPPGHSSPC